MAEHDPIEQPDDRLTEVPGDTGAADIVDRTGEQMPQQSHDGIEADDSDRRTHANHPDTDPARDSRRSHDNPRTGRISGW